MLSIVLVVSSLLSVASFMAPQPSRVSSSRVTMNDKWVGASVEVNGNQVYDPLDLLKLHSIAPTVFPHPKWLRESELKHCRIAMLASIGAFTAQYGLIIPGYTGNPDPVSNLNEWVTNFPFGFSQVLASIAVIEGVSNPTEFWFGQGAREAGDLGYDPLNLFRGKTDAQKDTLRLQELKNGRLAMIALAAYTSEHWIPGSVPFLPGKF